MSAKNDWLEANHDMLLEAWNEKLAAMQDSLEHRAHLAKSDRAFEEFCEEAFEESAVSRTTEYSTYTGLWFVYNSRGEIIKSFPLKEQAKDYIASAPADLRTRPMCKLTPDEIAHAELTALGTGLDASDDDGPGAQESAEVSENNGGRE